MLISLTSIYKPSVIETLKSFAGLQGEKRRIPVLMSRSRLRESTKLSPRGFQTSWLYRSERPLTRNLGKKTPPSTGRRSNYARWYVHL